MHSNCTPFKIDDGYEKRRTDGIFIKAGEKIYLFSNFSKIYKKGDVDPFVGLQLIAGGFYQYARYTGDDSVRMHGDNDLWALVGGIGIVGGANMYLSKNWNVDIGLQFPLRLRSERYIGFSSHNYEPGFGPAEVPQIILMLKWNNKRK